MVRTNNRRQRGTTKLVKTFDKTFARWITFAEHGLIFCRVPLTWKFWPNFFGRAKNKPIFAQSVCLIVWDDAHNSAISLKLIVTLIHPFVNAIKWSGRFGWMEMCQIRNTNTSTTIFEVHHRAHRYIYACEIILVDIRHLLAWDSHPREY